MTTITVRKDKKGAYRGFTCMGHAEYAKRGKPDILCAAISALTIGTVCSLEDLAGERLKITENEETGFPDGFHGIFPGKYQQGVR